eukprot:1538679-Prymnesium_polylepis.1
MSNEYRITAQTPTRVTAVKAQARITRPRPEPARGLLSMTMLSYRSHVAGLARGLGTRSQPR